MTETRLVVQSDDFGMCHAVNEGIERAMRDGIVTQASAMAPCPWFDEAAEIAQRTDAPVGLHLTLTCEWDRLRWAPLSGRPTLYAADRTFPRTVEDARATIAEDDAVAECLAQADRAVGAGLDPSYLDLHMGVVHPAAYQAACEHLDRPFAYPVVDAAFGFDSIGMVAGRSILRMDRRGTPVAVAAEPGERGFGWVARHLDSLGPGTHLLVCHVAEPGPELAAITSPGSDPEPWAEQQRAADLAMVLSSEVRDAIERRSIELTSVRDLRRSATPA